MKLYKKPSRLQLRSKCQYVELSTCSGCLSNYNVSLRLQEHWTAIGYGYVQYKGLVPNLIFMVLCYLYPIIINTYSLQLHEMPCHLWKFNLNNGAIR